MGRCKVLLSQVGLLFKVCSSPQTPHSRSYATTPLAHDFFAPQPIKNAGVFLLRNIMHDWSDAYCIQILRHLRAAAAPFTQLVIVDNIMSYACVEEDLKTIPGAERPLPPAPLLPNGGHAATIPYFQDIQVKECCCV